MVLDFQGLIDIEQADIEEEPLPAPQIKVVETDGMYGKFVVEPLEKGFGVTLGNPLRRVLYGSLEGSAVTWVKIEGVLHEYATIPHVKEEVSDFLLNIKGLRLSSEVDRPGKLRLEVSGEGEVCAGDIMATSDFEVVNPELHLFSLDSAEAKLSVEFHIERGTGYATASSSLNEHPIGTLPVDAIFKCVKKLYPHEVKLQLYQVHAVTEGTDAQATVSVRIEEKGKTTVGQAADTDTLVASANAYLNALNKMIIKRKKTAPEELSLIHI